MNSIVRSMTEADREQVLQMMRAFYASDAVYTNGSDRIFQTDIDHCIGGSPYIEGYVFEDSRQLQGYAMLAKSFSTEFGKPCIWIEDIYIRDGFRDLGIGSHFLRFIEEKYPGCLFRLEVEAENRRAVHVYRKLGYEPLPYVEMKKEL